MPWQKAVERYDRPHTLFYLDPPYWETEGYGIEFGLEQYQQMADIARSVAGAMVISLNDHPEMRRIFAGLHHEVFTITYTVGAGAGTPARELLIWNDHCETRCRQTRSLSLF